MSTGESSSSYCSDLDRLPCRKDVFDIPDVDKPAPFLACFAGPSFLYFALSSEAIRIRVPVFRQLRNVLAMGS